MRKLVEEKIEEDVPDVRQPAAGVVVELDLGPGALGAWAERG
jgi:hypothetical protein